VSLTSLTIPNNVTNIGEWAFDGCSSLTTATIGNRVTTIPTLAFAGCTRLTSLTIPNSVTSLGSYAFDNDTSLTNITIGNNVTYIGDYSFNGCPKLTVVYFAGNAPGLGELVFFGAGNFKAIAYYLPGSTGWANFFANTGGLPVVLWNAQMQTGGASFGVRTNSFGFNISGTSGLIVVVQACTNLANPAWFPVQTITLTGSPVYFSDPEWTNYTSRFYGLGVP
jgi:hypothetical protein